MGDDEFDSMHVHMMIPVISEEVCEHLREDADAALDDIDDPNLRALVDYIRFRTLGDALDATPLDAYAMQYTRSLLLGFMDHLMEQSGFYERVVDENGDSEMRQTPPNGPTASRGIKLMYAFDQAYPDSTPADYDAWYHSLDADDRRAVREDIIRLRDLQEWCAALSAASERLLIAIRDTVKP